MYGVTPYLIRRLAESGWDGGYGYSLHELGKLTLDQVWALCTDKKNLRSSERARKSSPSLLAQQTKNKDGKLRGRDKDGNVILGRVAGQSVASRLAAAAAARRAAEKGKEIPRRERKKNR